MKLTSPKVHVKQAESRPSGAQTCLNSGCCMVVSAALRDSDLLCRVLGFRV